MMRNLYWLIWVWPMTGLADPGDALDLLKRIKQNGQAQFRYEETRRLELAAVPWHGQGYMLSGDDGSLVKLQLKPSRIIMAITHEQMYYWDAEQQQRHTAPLEHADQAANQIKVFQAILRGDADQLQADYEMSAETGNKQWTLRLNPKPERRDDETPAFEISGDELDQQRRIVIRQTDGESTEYNMAKTSPEQAPTDSLQSLLREAAGD